MRRTRLLVKDDAKSYERALWIWNVVVIIIHSSSFVALTAIYFSQLGRARLVSIWADVNSVIDVRGEYALFATLLPFPLITAFFHFLATRNVDDYAHSVLVRGVNRLRWIEYAITNSLMSWSVLFVAGNGANVVLAVHAVLSNGVMQYFGYVHERTNAARNVSLGPLLVGFVPWLMNWAAVFAYYGARISTTSVTDALAIFGTWAWSLAFVAPLVYRWMQPDKTPRVHYNVERAYILLSLSAKLWLDWVVTIGNLAQ